MSLRYNKENSHLFVNDPEIIKFKSKDPEILPHALCLGKLSKNWYVDNMIKKRDEMDMFMILVLIVMLLYLMIF